MGISLPSLRNTQRQNSLKRGHQRSYCHEVFLLFDISIDTDLPLNQIHEDSIFTHLGLLWALYIYFHESLETFKIVGNYEKNNRPTMRLQSSNVVGYLCYGQREDTHSIVDNSILTRKMICFVRENRVFFPFCTLRKFSERPVNCVYTV